MKCSALGVRRRRDDGQEEEDRDGESDGEAAAQGGGSHSRLSEASVRAGRHHAAGEVPGKRRNGNGWNVYHKCHTCHTCHRYSIV